MPFWKRVDCPTCGALIGQSCGKTKLGASYWVRTAPHVARKRASQDYFTRKGVLW